MLRLYEGRETSPELLEWIAEHPEPEVRKALVERTDPAHYLRVRLCLDPDPGVRERAARWAPQETCELLMQDDDPQVRASIATWGEYLSEEQQLKLAQDPDPSVRAALLGRTTWLWSAAAAVLAEEPDERVQRALARSRYATSAILEKLLQHPNPEIRQLAAENSNLDKSHLVSALKQRPELISEQTKGRLPLRDLLSIAAHQAGRRMARRLGGIRAHEAGL